MAVGIWRQTWTVCHYPLLRVAAPNGQRTDDGSGLTHTESFQDTSVRGASLLHSVWETSESPCPCGWSPKLITDKPKSKHFPRDTLLVPLTLHLYSFTCLPLPRSPRLSFISSQSPSTIFLLYSSSLPPFLSYNLSFPEAFF